ncbi:MAG: hypothetical protein QOE90_1543 [Thermoplasmata archaeon]|jgi:FtsP/CotA-like multicopper oxidase with cupredoxin domain|nr:hypothetical protein [Thermoplasmata archaeon]
MNARRLLLGVCLAGVLALSGCLGFVTTASTQSASSKADAMLAHPPGRDVKPTGHTKEFDLYLFNMTMSPFPGANMSMWGFSFAPDAAKAQMPGPTIRVTEGDRVIIHFHPEVGGYNHTLHFHGQNVPDDQDGVPYLTQKVVEPGASFDYEFVAEPAGTYWYHCHVDAQHHIDMGMYGAMIVDPQDPKEDPHYDGEFLMMLDDMDRYHVEGGQPVAGTGQVPQGGDLYSYQDYGERTANDVLTRNQAVNPIVDQANTPVRPDRSWYPVTYAPYTANYQTYLINGMSFPYTQPLVVQEGKTYRIRMIDAGNEEFVMHLHGHHVLVTHVDGVLLESPYWVDNVVISPGQRIDAYFKADNPGIWDFHDNIGSHVQNDNIFPGGAMTMLCYQGVPGCPAGMEHMSMRMHSGDLIGWDPRVLV